MKRDLYVGIDVACSPAKALPVVIAAATGGGTLMPLPGPKENGYPQWPKGVGNVAIAVAGPGPQAPPAAPHPAWVLAQKVRDTLLAAENALRGKVLAIGIDAPRHPAPINLANGKPQLRCCEAAMTAKGISFIQTPSNFGQICARAAAHRGPANNLPHKNQLWMVQGFALFDVLSAQWGAASVVETYPYAAFAALNVTALKAQPAGRCARLVALEKYCGLAPRTLRAPLRNAAVGREHDKIDAFVSAALAWRHGNVLGNAPGQQIVMP